MLNGSKGILVDKKLIEGPNPNERGKILIPVILAFQVSLYELAFLWYLYPIFKFFWGYFVLSIFPNSFGVGEA